VERDQARLAYRSHGVVTRARLIAAGVSLDEIRQRLATGALIREYPGVYRVGHRAPRSRPVTWRPCSRVVSARC
jgi:hypothetical protein